MISFMVLGGPRTGTTWMANLLTTDHTHCLHDPLLEYKVSFLDTVQIPGKKMGISCTSSLLYTEWLLKHPAKKIILWREPGEMNAALRTLGLRELDPGKHARYVYSLTGVKIYDWRTIFTMPVARDICKFFDVPFCPWRFNELAKMNIQPEFTRIPVGKDAVQELSERVRKELES